VLGGHVSQSLQVSHLVQEGVQTGGNIQPSDIGVGDGVGVGVGKITDSHL
jgi:hypothetical protein